MLTVGVSDCLSTVTCLLGARVVRSILLRLYAQDPLQKRFGTTSARAINRSVG